MTNGTYPGCGKCKTGVLLPVNLGMGSEQSVRYRCTNPECNARFDEHGYEIFDVESESWKRISSG
ncbi:MAG: hypothetical protein JSV49_08815 [Thermoplasmata archaeon]|nr:MAG: hypothetical protein JSV49_08815 [Thermoplasmata archaeon]